MSILTRGRLIMRFKAEIHRLDPSASAAVPNGGYDDVFDEMVPVQDGTALGGDSRRELDPILLPCQVDIEADQKGINEQKLTRGGYDEMTDLVLTLFMPDLEAGGYVDANGHPELREGDRVARILDQGGNVAWEFEYPPGLMVQWVEPRGFGIALRGTPKFNLVYLHCHVPRQGGTT